MRPAQDRPEPAQLPGQPWMLLALFALAMTTPAQAGPGERPRAQALRLYQQGNYDEACPLYEKLAAAAKVAGALWADLGLCELRRGRQEASRHASLLAVRHGDDAVRKRAYFNLHASGYRARLPGPGAELSCDFLAAPSQLGCKKRLWACVVPWRQYGSGGGEMGSNAVFGSDAEGLEALKAAFGAGYPVGAAADGNALPLSLEVESFCGYCHMHAWDCASSPVVMPRVEQCFRKSTDTTQKSDPEMCLRRTPSDAKRCDEYMKCYAQQCERAQDAYDSDRALWPQAADEIAEAHDERCRDCGIQESTRCEVIVVDSCRGRVGYVCQRETRGKKEKLTVQELTLAERNETP